MHPDPGKNEAILVVNEDGTAGRLLTVKGDEADPIAITLQPTGTVAGRLVDEEGRPRPNVPFVVMQDLKTVRFERFSVQPPTGPEDGSGSSASSPALFTASMPSRTTRRITPNFSWA